MLLDLLIVASVCVRGGEKKSDESVAVFSSFSSSLVLVLMLGGWRRALGRGLGTIGAALSSTGRGAKSLITTPIFYANGDPHIGSVVVPPSLSVAVAFADCFDPDTPSP